METYLVTGAAGFIAARVVDNLLAAGHGVIGIDNLNDAYDQRLKHWRLRQLTANPRFQFHQLDICDLSALRAVLLRQTPIPSAIINLAARAGVRQSVENPWVYYETNVTGTLNLLEVGRALGIRKFILASTSSLYGLGNPVPYQESANTDGPLSPYSASKKAAEALCFTYHYLYGVNVTVFRYFTVYGPAGRPDMSLFRFVQRIHEGRPITVFGDGRQNRDFTYVDDVVRGTVAGLQLTGHQVVNLGSSSPVVLMDAVEMIERMVGRKAMIGFQPAHATDVRGTWADISRAGVLLNWAPKVQLEEGLSQLVAWYQENRAWASDVATD